ncbi:MAG TPA: DUF1194 domain-containing protein [Alphaproteobacteria bacterium]|nr:DUF1194 domain-containing protein [Alphaproteobacteria bacterium]
MPISPLLRRLALLSALCTASLAPALSARAAPLPVDLELILAVDVSGSVDAIEAKLQREGYISAMTSDTVMKAIKSGPYRRIALAYVEWAGEQYQQTLMPWTLIESKEDAQKFMAQVADAPYVAIRWTSISAAIDYSAKLFAESPYEGTRRVVDISGDGKNNHGREVADARRDAMAAGIIINGLPILSSRAGAEDSGALRGWPSDPDLDSYYQTEVIGGPGAFMVPAESFDTFAEAVKSKLMREIANIPPGIQIEGDTQFAYGPRDPKLQDAALEE